jgi:carbamoyltransferase
MKTNPIIISLAHNYHDSCISLSFGNEIIASLECERIFRAKKICASPAQMELAVSFILKRFNLNISDIDYFILGALNNPYSETTSFEDISEFKINFQGRKIPALIIRHHLAHAGFYYCSPFNDALIVSCDGGGDLGERIAYFEGKGQNIKRVNAEFDNHISTKPYGQFSSFLYNEPFSEGKLMALASYGAEDMKLNERVEAVFPLLKNVTFREGQNILNKHFPEFSNTIISDFDKAAQLASSVQKVFIAKRLSNISDIYNKSLSKNIVLVGGSALNLACNSEIYNRISKNIYIPPCCDDTGIAIGQNAVAISYLLNKRAKCNLPYVGVGDNEFEVQRLKRSNKNNFDIVDCPNIAARKLFEGKICISHINRPEVGPRALGHRSFLLGANNKNNKQIISEIIKKREWYRPVAPIVLEEDLEKYFSGGPNKSEYMLFSYEMKKGIKELFPAINHFDNTARIQTINQDNCKYMFNLLTEYKRLSGSSILINTSLNLKNEPLSNFLWDTYNIARKIHFPSFIFQTPNT